MKHQHILKDDAELSKVFPNGAKDFQVSERREAENIKEILAKSKVRMLTNDEDDPGSRPCDRECSYCHLLRETEGKDFKSVTTGCKYKVRQKITCEAKDVIYPVTCKRHNIQGVGCTMELKSRISNYRSHHNKKNKSCGITEHFLKGDHIFEEHFQIQPIVRLLNPPRTVSKKRERLEEFELYWQMNLITYEPHGMNKQSEIEKTKAKIKNRRIRDTKRK